MATSELSEVTGLSKRGLWFGAGALISFGLVVTTALVPFDRPIFRQFDLGVESNLASLWSGLMLLISALHAYDGWAGNRRHNLSWASAWLVIAAALAALSLDEIGSLHERVELIKGWPGRALISGIAAVYGLAVAYSLFILYRSHVFASSARLISISVALLVTVPVQEYIQGQLTWPGYLDVLRVVVEEGTEILAIVLFFKASLVNTRGYLGPDPSKTFPFFQAVVDLRDFLLIAGFMAAVAFAWVGPSLAAVANFSQSGMPSAWLAGAFYFVAALAFVRPWLRSGQSIGWQTWTLVGLSLFACATTVVSPEAYMVHVCQAILSGSLILLCVLDKQRPTASFLPMVFFLAIALAVAWPLEGDPVFDALLVELVAMAFFFVATAPKAHQPAPSAQATPRGHERGQPLTGSTTASREGKIG